MNLDKKISSCLSFIRADAKHDLPLHMRLDLMSSLNLEGKHFDKKLGRSRRVLLSLLTIKKVLPLWIENLQDNLPQAALRIANEVVQSKFDPDEANEFCQGYWDECDNIIAEFAGDPNIIMVGYGAVQTIRMAIEGDIIPDVEELNKVTDIDVEPYDHDPAFLACAAYAGGAVWDKDSDALKRLEFWTWWLQTVKEVAK